MSLKKDSRKRLKDTNFLYDFVKVTGMPSAFILCRPKVIHISDKARKHIKGGVMIASNHITFIDPIIIHFAFWYRRLNFLATKDLFKSRLKQWFFEVVHCIVVDKNNFTMRSLHAVCDKLKQDKAVVIFPEGTVGKDENNVQPFKSGAILMAHISGKPIVPIYIIPAKSWHDSNKIIVGEPIDLTELCGKIPSAQQIEDAAKHLRQKEQELIDFYYTTYKKNKKEQQNEDQQRDI